MGFFRRLFGAKKTGSSPSAKEKRRWSFARSSNTIPSNSNKLDAFSGPYDDNLDANKHAIAVAAATAAVAEAALAAAQAAAEVVRLTTVGDRGGGSTVSNHVSGSHRRWAEELAAVRIQSAFRRYLARRALRALKALVKLQALVRGHIVRKQTADMLRRMQTLVRVQARARARRTHFPEFLHSSASSSQSHHARSGSSSNFRDIIHLDGAKVGPNWLDHWMEQSFQSNHGSIPTRSQNADDENSDKILEVDTWKPHIESQQSIRAFQTWQHGFTSDHRNRSFTTSNLPSKLSTKSINQMPTVSSGEVSSLNSLKFPLRKDEAGLRTVENSPHVFSPSSRPGSSKRGPFTPTRSECAWGFFNGYSGYPNYMANTESFQAKVRSQSAPRQRLEFERHNPSTRSAQGFFEADTISERSFAQQTNFRNSAYPASGRFNRQGSTDLR